MARKILTPEEYRKFVIRSDKYHEYHEDIKGHAKFDMYCDNSGDEIRVGDLCYAICSFPTKDHDNYEIHKPEAWVDEYLQR